MAHGVEAPGGTPGPPARAGSDAHHPAPTAGVWWLEDAPHTPRPALDGRVDVDVAVVGGGYTGLWSAYHLLTTAPGTRIAVLERDDIGFGASGRNGGFAMSLLDLSLTHLRRRQGDAAARAAHLAVAASVDGIGATVRTEGIDCDWVRGGLLTVATNPAQLERLDADAATAAELGLDGFHRLSRRETRAAVDSATYLGGLFDEHCGIVQPAKLARGLADAVERHGGQVFERTGLQRLEEGAAGNLRITTPGGEVRAGQLVVATNAWAVTTPWFRAKVLPLYTYVLLTAPLSPEQWASVGWEQWQGVEDKRSLVHYYRPTADGRIAWGWAAGAVPYPTTRVRGDADPHAESIAQMAATFRRTFPQLHDVPFTHAWGGPVGITGDMLPLVGTLADHRLHYALGYNGHGVAPSHTAGRILANKVLGQRGELADLCFVDAPEVRFPPEPLRWVGAALTTRAMRRQDERFDAGSTDGADRDPLLIRALERLG